MVSIVEFISHEGLSITAPLHLIDRVLEDDRIVEQLSAAGLECDYLLVERAFVELMSHLCCLFVLRGASETARAIRFTVGNGIHDLISINRNFYNLFYNFLE